MNSMANSKKKKKMAGSAKVKPVNQKKKTSEVERAFQKSAGKSF